MKSSNVLRHLLATILFVITLGALPALCQEGRLQIEFLNKLEPKATETVDVTVDGDLLKLAIAFLNTKDPDQAKAKEIISGLRGIYVKVFEFGKPGQYTQEDLEQIRRQLQAPNWKKIVGVRSIKDGDNVDVYTMVREGKIDGMAVLVAEPNELTVVNIVGTIDLEKLAALSGTMGIPKVKIDFSAGDSAKEK